MTKLEQKQVNTYNLAWESHKADCRKSIRRIEPLELLYPNILQWLGWNSAEVITSARINRIHIQGENISENKILRKSNQKWKLLVVFHVLLLKFLRTAQTYEKKRDWQCSENEQLTGLQEMSHNERYSKMYLFLPLTKLSQVQFQMTNWVFWPATGTCMHHTCKSVTLTSWNQF